MMDALEKRLEWNKWATEIPYISWPTAWQIKAVPPFHGAIIRYRVKKGDKDVSVYLDCYDILGVVGEPYWEVYPVEGDVGRCLMNETDRLLEIISSVLDDEQLS